MVNSFNGSLSRVITYKYTQARRNESPMNSRRQEQNRRFWNAVSSVSDAGFEPATFALPCEDSTVGCWGFLDLAEFLQKADFPC
jgi:hypothetical protein